MTSPPATLSAGIAGRLRRPDSLRRLVGVTLGFIVLTAVMTAPLLWRLAVALPDHDDAYFSVWRLAWVAHQLPLAPAKLFDANIFHPTRGTLLLSDAMVLLGLAGTLPIRLGVHPVAVHNALLFLGFVSSGVGVFVLAHSLTGQTGPAVLAGIIFAFAPFRFGHVGHLELQWACWMPLALWAVHRLFNRGLARYGVLLGLFLALQGFSSLYYLALFLPFLVILLAVLVDRRPALFWKQRVVGLSAAAVVVAVVLGPYLLMYYASHFEHPPRSPEEVARYSASLSSHLRVAPSNRLYGILRNPVDADELSLFPGVIAIAFAALAFRGKASRLVAAYAAGLLVAFLVSLGPGGGLFSLVRLAVIPLTSLRAPARADILVLLSLAVLSAFGAGGLMTGWRRSTRAVALTMACLICLAEYWSVPMRMTRPVLRAPLAYQWLARQPADTVLLALPASAPKVNYDALNDYLSIYHWQRLVNGYSGFSPPGYVATQALLSTFPDAASVQRLRALSVSYVVVNMDLYPPDEYGRLARRLVSDPNFDSPLEFRDPLFRAVVFPLRPDERRQPAGGDGAAIGTR